MFKLTFLSASLPLTKTISRVDGEIIKTPYPLVANFTSYTHEINTIGDFHKLLVKNATSAQKPCLLKGQIKEPLVCQSRKGSTNTNDATRWVCLDLDRAPFSTPDEVMKALSLDDVSYIVQYSSSYKLDKKDKRLSCHIFFLLSRPLAAPQLKAWLMHLNQSVPVLERAIELSKSCSALHWPLDITTCQNDKLLYVAVPTFVGMNSPIAESERIKLVSNKLPHLPVERVELKPIENLKKKAREKLNQLRTDAGFSVIKTKPKMIGEYEVQTSAGEIAVYEVIDCGEYNRLNLNGGDSQAYWHHKTDPTYLHNFKGEPSLLLKEVLPHYYADLVRNAKHADTTPSVKGEMLLAFRDKKTATYWKGTWHEGDKFLDLHRVDSIIQLDHFLQSHGRSLGSFVPEWQIVFDPHSMNIVDERAKIVNTFQPTDYMRKGKKAKAGEYPIIQRIIDHCVGTGEIQEHFMNWLAVVWQQRRKPLTAWVLHGTQGTGKGTLFHKVLRPLFGRTHAVYKKAAELGEQFNGWLEPALVVLVDEIEADMFLNANSVEATLKTMITEPTQPIRRMRTDSYEVENAAAFVFASNKKRPVVIPMGDRRFNVGVYQPNPIDLDDEQIDKIEGELEAFTYYLSTRKADFSKAKTVLQTADRAAMQRLSVTSVDQLASQILTGNLIGLWEAMPDEDLANEMGIVDTTAMAYSSLIKRFSREQTSKLTRDELGLIFRHCVGKIPEGAQKLATYLNHHGISLRKMRLGNKFISGIEVTWVVNREDREAINGELGVQKTTRMKRVK